ncbi:MAG: glutamine synthetase family protein [Oscillospiraceae bacterium]|nr:glutamine synthetase family protein [Oscillospiraceae bacterium]
MYNKTEAFDFIKDNDVKFIRLAFCDIFGVQKNVSIMPYELERAFESGISFDASSIDGFGEENKSDLFLIPDPSTLSLLPWRPSRGRVARFFCDVRSPGLVPFEFDSRLILKKAVRYAADKGFYVNFGAECEFYLFKTDESGAPTSIPYDNGGYMDISPVDKCENIRREICLTLEEMGLYPESSHHECGPGQNEIDFKYNSAMTSADNFIAFKAVVSAVAERNGLYASFMPKPINRKDGSGLHINMSVHRFGEASYDSKLAENFMAGILNKIAEITLFLNTAEQSYKRLGEYKAPRYITWSPQNRSQLIRIPAAEGEYSRIELRSPDPLANPYIAFALLIYSGLEGIDKALLPPPPTNLNLFAEPLSELIKIKALPDSINEAYALASESEFVTRTMPSGLADMYLKDRI